MRRIWQFTREAQYHGLINYMDIKAKCRHLKELTCKGTLRHVFIRVYRLEIKSVMLVCWYGNLGRRQMMTFSLSFMTLIFLQSKPFQTMCFHTKFCTFLKLVWNKLLSFFLGLCYKSKKVFVYSYRTPISWTVPLTYMNNCDKIFVATLCCVWTFS